MTIIDMHIHLEYRSRCSNLTVDQLNNNLSPIFDGIYITDHWNINKHKKNPFNPHIKVYYGIEITCDRGDILCYGINTSPLKKRMIKADYIIEYVHKRGGIAVCAHPYSNRHRGFGDSIYKFDFDAIEINGILGEEYQEMAKKAAKKMNIPLIGGSDAHSVNHLNTVATEFEVSINTMEDIVNAVKNKKCKVITINT